MSTGELSVPSRGQAHLINAAQAMANQENPQTKVAYQEIRSYLRDNNPVLKGLSLALADSALSLVGVRTGRRATMRSVFFEPAFVAGCRLLKDEFEYAKMSFPVAGSPTWLSRWRDNNRGATVTSTSFRRKIDSVVLSARTVHPDFMIAMDAWQQEVPHAYNDATEKLQAARLTEVAAAGAFIAISRASHDNVVTSVVMDGAVEIARSVASLDLLLSMNTVDPPHGLD